MKEINFTNIPLLAGLDRVNLAKLIPNFEQSTVKSGEILFRQGDPGDTLYIIVDGLVRVFLEPGGRSREIACLGPGECFGEMALLTGEPRSADIQAMTDLILLKLSKDRFDDLIKKHPSLAVNFAGLLANRLSLTDAIVSGREEMAIPGEESFTAPESKIAISQSGLKPPPLSIPIRFLKNRMFWGILLVTVLCILSTLFLKTTSLHHFHITLIVLLIAATVLWSLDVFSYHAVSISLILFTVLFGVTSPEKAFSGFASPSWFLVLSVFAISAAISKTGLLYRLVLLIIKRFPPNYIGQTFGLALSGLLLTPVIPSPNGRVILASPLVLTLSEILGFKKGSSGSVGMAMACLLGFGHMSFMFMNGAATVLLVLGLLPSDTSFPLTWGGWLKTSSLLGIFFFLCTYIAIIILYHPKEKTTLNTLVIEAQLRILGPMTVQEKISIITIVIFLLGFLTQTWHQINAAWVAMLSFLILFAGSVLDEKSVRSDIDWNFLISFGAFVGFGNVITASGLSKIIAMEVKPYLEIFTCSQLILFGVIIVAVFSLRFILPLPPTLLVSTLSTLPVTSTLGIHPLVIGLVILASANPWFFPYQNMMYQNILDCTEGKLFNHEQTLKLACLHVLIVMASVTISFPYWKSIGLIH